MRLWKSCACLVDLDIFYLFCSSRFFPTHHQNQHSKWKLIKFINIIDTFVSSEPQAGAVLSRNSHDDITRHVTGVCVTAQREGKPPTNTAVFFDLHLLTFITCHKNQNTIEPKSKTQHKKASLYQNGYSFREPGCFPNFSFGNSAFRTTLYAI